MLTGVLWKYASGGLALLALVLFILWKAEARHADKLEDRVAYYRAELQRISTAKDEQKATTAKNIRKAQEKVRVVERVVTKLESRPIPPSAACVTPDLEEWRAVL